MYINKPLFLFFYLSGCLAWGYIAYKCLEGVPKEIKSGIGRIKRRVHQYKVDRAMDQARVLMDAIAQIKGLDK